MDPLDAKIQRLLQHVFVADKTWCNEEELIYIATILLGDSADDTNKKAEMIGLLKKGGTMQDIPFREPHWFVRIPDQTLFDERFPRLHG